MTQAEQSLHELLARAAAGPRRAEEPGFLRALRDAGSATFAKVGLPTTRHEDWRYTSLSGLSGHLLAPALEAAVGTSDLPPAPRLVFVNGRLHAPETDLGGLPPGVRMGSLAAALAERPGALEPHLGRVAPAGGRAFAALNAALFEDGALVEIGDGVRCEVPLHLVFLSGAVPAVAGGLPVAHPRNLVVAGRGAKATIVESYRGEEAYLVNGLTELVLGEGAEVEHDRVQEDAPRAVHVGGLELAQAAASRFTGGSIALGAQLARVETRALLGGEGAACDLHGLSVAGGKQVIDHFVHVEHASPRCTSREVFKGVLDGLSRGVFAGRVKVREGAVKTDASQVSSSLLLSDDATVDTRPQLEILNDDVKCSHGGTVGQLREDQLFYLRSRGVPQALARAMLTWAFAAEMVERVGPEALRARVRRAVTARLPSGELLEVA